MYISLANSRAHGFKKWADDQRRGNDDDNGGENGPPIPISDPPVDDQPIGDPAARHGRPHRPWLVPGAGSSF